MFVQHRHGIILSHTALYSNEKMKSDLVNNFAEIGPASLDLKAADSAPVQLSQKIFDYYLGGVRVEKEDADKLCQVRPSDIISDTTQHIQVKL